MEKINLLTLFPHQDGFVIFDSPEVGESDIMDDIAFAFIYVIKSSNAGGVQSSELGE